MYLTALVLAGGASRRMGRDKLSLPVTRHARVTILQHVVTTVQRVAQRVIVLVPPHDDGSLWNGSFRRRLDIRTLSDTNFFEGPLRALANGWPTIPSIHPDFDTTPNRTCPDGETDPMQTSVYSDEAAQTQHAVLVVGGDYPGLQEAVLLAVVRAFRIAMAAENGSNVSPQLTTAEGVLKAAAAIASTRYTVPDGVVLRREGIPQPLLGCYRTEVGIVLKGEVSQGERRLMRAATKLNLLHLDTRDTTWPDWWTRPVHTPEDYQLWLHANQD